jgi:type II secretory pathway predicted ATPase ExeA
LDLEALPEGRRCAVNAWFNPLSAFVTVLYLEDKGKQAGEQKRLIVAESVEKHRE